jgi:hypothetical protein
MYSLTRHRLRAQILRQVPTGYLPFLNIPAHLLQAGGHTRLIRKILQGFTEAGE